ncbi:hypothetical protein QY96_03035 [Bacillus thermotolerans]|nr:hypothetical protein QY96_03035 [Bacillus thermotolerans]
MKAMGMFNYCLEAQKLVRTVKEPLQKKSKNNRKRPAA